MYRNNGVSGGSGADRDDTVGYAESLYQKFNETKQEALRLSAALTGFFLEDGVSQTHKTVYETYLRRRIRPAVELLIDRDDVDKITRMEELGWFDARLIDHFIKTARSRGKTSALVALMHLKNEKYGYTKKGFDI